MKITAYFEGLPGDKNDKEVHDKMKSFGGTFVGSGNDLTTGIRDIEYKFSGPEFEKANDCIRHLEGHGYKVTHD